MSFCLIDHRNIENYVDIKMHSRSEYFKNPLLQLAHPEGTYLRFDTTSLKSTYHSQEDNRSRMWPYGKEWADVMKREVAVRGEDSSKEKVVNETGESRAKYWKAGCAAR